MPLVRILSDDAQYREKLKHDLQARGFEVEAATDAEGGEDAPPQISISECSFEDLPKLAASLQQGSGAVGQVSTDAIAFLVPQLLSGNTRSLKAFVVRSQPEPELAPEAQATPQSAPNELRDQGDAALPASASVPVQAPAQQAREVAGAPKFRAHFRKKKEEESELVPHGLIWQAISEASAVSSQQPTYEAAQEGMRAEASLGQESLKRESLEPEPPKREMPLAKGAPARPRQSSSTFPYHALRIRAAKLRLLAPFHSKNARDRRFRNVAAFALGAAILAVIALPHMHRIAPLPSNVEAHIPQPAESVPAHVSDKPSPIDAENVSRHSVAVAQPVKNVASSSHEEKSGLLAKDTVVHFAPKTTQADHDLASKQPQRKDGVRYISDLD